MAPHYAETQGFDKMPDFHHNLAVVPTEHIVIPAIQNCSEYTIKDLADVDRALVFAYDAKVSQRNRPKYLINFITTGRCFSKVMLFFLYFVRYR
ncbi:hypothetical protein OESDEN_19487 [Oesophagostomum dentatum]|uniref:Uncharacterized protein n=1 Tax=Oesophagostomum dentatum TaxID=61180 RepID=A0A0B1S660_OESDE|nr:hypothetical protein OESDEN_19487 [Oesophagostomum dentatum]